MKTPVFRFAPSPNGYLHLGHAASALLNAQLAADSGGRFLLRIEDIDTTRCKPDFERAIREDLAWLGLRWEEPVMRQSERFECYRESLDRLEARRLIYPCFCSRSQIATQASERERDPDGAPLYGGRCRNLAHHDVQARKKAGEPFRLRLSMDLALKQIDQPIIWTEFDHLGATRSIIGRPDLWGDVVLLRKEFPASYHLAVVVDDAEQGITDVVRGADLFASTAVHRLLQTLLDLPEPRYRHHGLMRNSAGEKLSKSANSPSLRDLRAQGATPGDIRRLVREAVPSLADA
jgi:glutamyl-Q tRNA(Asp) synthetase